MIVNSHGIVKGIPTRYRSTQFRSRLEARWAAFFDIVLWDWIYEPVDVRGYIPDFLIQGNRPMFIEVGPCITESDYIDKSEKADKEAAHLQHDFLVVGVTPLPSRDRGETLTGYPIAGLMGEYIPLEVTLNGSGGGMLYEWKAGGWHRCVKCRAVAVHHSTNDYTSRPCGHYDGDHFLGGILEQTIDDYWQEAGNAVQWKPSEQLNIRQPRRPAGQRTTRLSESWKKPSDA
jgi:hypothetical protein